VKQITRARALELAQECIQKQMQVDYNKLFPGMGQEPDYTSGARYEELAAALYFIENLARQKELL